MTNVLNVFAGILWLFGSSMIVPAAVATAVGEYVATMEFVITLVLTVFVAGSMAFAVRGRARGMNRTESYVLLLLAWTVLPIVAAVPFLTLSELGPLDAYMQDPDVTDILVNGAYEVYVERLGRCARERDALGGQQPRRADQAARAARSQRPDQEKGARDR